MSDLPTLFVDADPADIIAGNLSSYGFRIDGPLPTVPAFIEGNFDNDWTRPLRAGDRVALATKCQWCEGAGWDWKRVADDGLTPADPVGEYPCPECTNGYVPFATATVASVTRSLPMDGSPDHHSVTVVHVEAS